MLSYKRIVVFAYYCDAKQIADVMRLIKYLLFVFFLFIAAVNAAAQGLVVKQFYHNDATLRQTQAPPASSTRTMSRVP